jgi:hypothetical protein
MEFLQKDSSGNQSPTRVIRDLVLSSQNMQVLETVKIVF